MHGFRRSVSVHKLHAFLGYAKIPSKACRIGGGVQGKRGV